MLSVSATRSHEADPPTGGSISPIGHTRLTSAFEVFFISGHTANRLNYKPLYPTCSAVRVDTTPLPLGEYGLSRGTTKGA